MTAVFDDHRSLHSYSGFAIATAHKDGSTARLRLSGRLDGDAAAVLAATAAGHLHFGRRFLRLDLSRVVEVTDDALPRLIALHQRVLASRGTLILTGVAGSVAARLGARAPEMLWVSKTAEDKRVEGIG